MVHFGSPITPNVVFFLTNTIKFGTSVHFSCIIIALGVISIIRDSMEHASCLLLECINLILELQAP